MCVIIDDCLLLWRTLPITICLFSLLLSRGRSSTPSVDVGGGLEKAFCGRSVETRQLLHNRSLSSSKYLGKLNLIDFFAEQDEMNFEEVVVWKRVMELVGAPNKVFMDVVTADCRGNRELNASWLLDSGWCGLSVSPGDQLANSMPGYFSPWQVNATPSNFKSLVEQFQKLIPGVIIDFLRIAAGDASYHLWESLGIDVRPRIISAEANLDLGFLVFSTSDHFESTPQWQSLQTKARKPLDAITSMRAMHELAMTQGYSLVHISQAGAMLFVRSDVLKGLHFAYGVVIRHVNELPTLWRRAKREAVF